MMYFSTLVLTFSLLLSSHIALAHDHSDNSFSVGLKAGAMLFDPAGIKTDSLAGARVSYLFNSNLALELDYLRGSTKSGLNDSRVDVETLGLYGVLRSGNTAYGLLKVGVSNELASLSDTKHDEVQLSAGLGGGVVINRQFSIESEYTLITDNTSFIGFTFLLGF